MSWGIAATASELEKLKAESADYLNGLNSCGEIDYSTYSHAFDFYADLIEKAYKFGKDTDVPSNVPDTNVGDIIHLDWIQRYADDWEDMSYAYDNPILGMLEDWRREQDDNIA